MCVCAHGRLEVTCHRTHDVMYLCNFVAVAVMKLDLCSDWGEGWMLMNFQMIMNYCL